MRFIPTRYQRPEILLMLMAAAVPLSFATWSALINNFAVEMANFGGAEIGILQSIREVPGFLALLFVFALLIMREQTLALVMLALLGLGTAATGFFPSLLGLCITAFIGSVGFHFYDTAQQSLSLQWFEIEKTPEVLGRLIAVGSAGAIASYGLVWLAFKAGGLDFKATYLIGGGLTLVIMTTAALGFPHFPEKVVQKKTLILRRRYWLYYALTFMSGARRQIFIVFAGFLLVQKFGFPVENMALLFLATSMINVPLAPRIGRLVRRWGERPALILEYSGLIIVFTAYAFVTHAMVAAALYIIDHLFFALAIAIRTYFQKIADPADIASTAGVSFTINHIAAVMIPAALGIVWVASPPAVFLSGAAMAAISLFLSLLVPGNPTPGNETIQKGAGIIFPGTAGSSG